MKVVPVNGPITSVVIERKFRNKVMKTSNIEETIELETKSLRPWYSSWKLKHPSTGFVYLWEVGFPARV